MSARSVSGSDRWVPELRAAASQLGLGKGAGDIEKALFAGIADLQASVGKRDVAAAKIDWLAAVNALEYFARAVGIQKEVAGL